MISQTLNINIMDGHGVDYDNGTLNYCRLNDISVQAWSPFQ
jgi:predicted oxidoreductase